MEFFYKMTKHNNYEKIECLTNFCSDFSSNFSICNRYQLLEFSEYSYYKWVKYIYMNF
mgnify:CR=1 FL=1